MFNDLLPQAIITLINYTLNVIFTGSAKVILIKYFDLIVDFKITIIESNLSAYKIRTLLTQVLMPFFICLYSYSS